MKSMNCPACDSSAYAEETYSREVALDGRKISVQGLKRYVCKACETVFSDDGQTRYNLSLIQRAKGQTPNLVLGSEIRTFRDTIGITQREASKLFGGGLNAFSKYETGEVVQSEAMDNLVWLAIKLPGLVPELAKRRGVSLSEKVQKSCGSLLQISFEVTKTISTIAIVDIADRGQYFGSYMFHTIARGSTTRSSNLTISASANDGAYQLKNFAGT